MNATIKRARVALGTALAAVLATTLVSQATGATASAKQGSVPGAVALKQSKSQLSSLEEAVVVGKLDAKVVEVLRRKGEIEAMVTFAYRSILDGAFVGPLRAKAVLAETKTEFAEQEEAAIETAGADAEVVRDYDNLPVSFVRFSSEDALLDILNAEDVTGVRENLRGTVTTSESLRLIRQPETAAAGFTGSGAYVAVLDTAGRTYEYGDRDGLQDDGKYKGWPSPHGTNVAGIVSAVAPGAGVIQMDVFTNGTYWTPDALSQAIRQAIQLKAAGTNIVAMNMSLGTNTTYYNSACNSSLAGVFATARQWGILPVVSSGNDAYGTEGRDPFRKGISLPACIQGVMSVGAVHDSAHSAAVARQAARPTRSPRSRRAGTTSRSSLPARASTRPESPCREPLRPRRTLRAPRLFWRTPGSVRPATTPMGCS